ncbi:hypothetical protein W97_04812 [Coniosporium apollinis CBS 100218]|uniref:Mannosyltransferase n=1 Tax=Coniosporium apollinis (strain CBS 100218) TaxID=1168221 RepID=R7YUU1_CONA1|nr:uncharacterized protein W97_04812 [Coniosporium apollinis CBS 100218]EON65574.1 hypothetical protein W97_04812 [Coniosporium apollinis CBS 100218]
MADAVREIAARQPPDAGTAASKPKPKAPQKQPEPMEPIIAFYIFLAAHLAAALYSPIQDCDEVYNYWEPTHYLNHGYGMQTWEYSPEYAIRSWTYAGIHSIVVLFSHLLPVGNTKRFEFYFVRVILGFICAFSEARLFAKISKTLNPRIAILFLVIAVSSPGMFHASVAYLPSSFAMYTTINGLAAFMDWRGGMRTAQGIMWFGVGAVIGWPFSGVLVLPFVLEEILMATMTDSVFDMARRFLDGTVRSFIALALQVCIDTFFYKAITCVPWNIVAYNIFSGPGKGPNIYGTEPWGFYIRNLLINFNVWFGLALLAYPLVLLQHAIRGGSQKQPLLRSLTFVTPFYLWLAIFTVQPHKEERFMYPAYPLLAFNAAMSFHAILSYLGSTDTRDIVSKIPARFKLIIVSLFVLGAVDLGVLRALGMVTAYSAPLKVYKPLQQPGVALPGDTVCFGKEWHRFPSSFFLPNDTRAKFVKSAFTGLLPGEFSEANVGFGFFPGAWLVPSGMNDENREDPGKHTDIDYCKFMVDSYFPNSTASKLEPDYVLDTKTWETLACEPFLDTARTGTLARLLWVPDWPSIPEEYRRKWGQYCLLRRRESPV